MQLATSSRRLHVRRWSAGSALASDLTRLPSVLFEGIHSEPIRPHMNDGCMVVAINDGGRERYVRLAPIQRGASGPVASRVRRKRQG